MGRRRAVIHDTAPLTPQGSASRLQRKLRTGGPKLSNYLRGRGISGIYYDTGTHMYWVKGIKYDPDINKQILYEMLRSGRVFEARGNTSAQIGKSIDDHVKARAGVVSIAGTKKFGFATRFGVRMRTKYWEFSVYREKGRWKPRWWYQPRVNKLKAMKDAYSRKYGKRYEIACWAATKITMHAGSGSMSEVKDKGVNDKDWIPGDWGYVQNTKFRGKAGQRGMNLIYVGSNKWWGHVSKAVTYDTLSGWEHFIVVTWGGKDKLLNWRKRTGVGLY